MPLNTLDKAFEDELYWAFQVRVGLKAHAKGQGLELQVSEAGYLCNAMYWIEQPRIMALIMAGSKTGGSKEVYAKPLGSALRRTLNSIQLTLVRQGFLFIDIASQDSPD